MAHTSSVFTVYEDVDGNNEFYADLEPDKDIQFNVIAVVEKDQIAIPYKSITLHIPHRPAYGGPLFIAVLFGLIILFGFVALYFYIRGKSLEQRLAEEVRDVGNNQSYRKIKDSFSTN